MTLRDALAGLHAAARRDREDRSPLRRVDARAKTAVTALYLAALLSTPLDEPLRILSFAIYPLLLAALAGVDHGMLLRRSLVVMPFVVAVAVFNPFYDRVPMFELGGRIFTRGEITLLTLPLRALLAAEGLWLLILSTSTTDIVRSLCRAGVPRLFAVQLHAVNRNVRILVAEALAMQEARRARSFGCRGYTLRFRADMVAQLLLRSVARAERIEGAMAARGFEGDIPDTLSAAAWRWRDVRFCLVWCAVLLLLRIQPFFS